MATFFSKENLKKIALIFLVILPVTLALGINFFKKKAPESSPEVEDKTFQLYLYCPTVDEFCEKGKIIVKNNVYLGYGAKIPSGPVKTSFNGRLTASTINLGKEKVNVIYLDNEQGEIRAIYTFKGTVLDLSALPKSPNGYVKVGTEIGKITSDIKEYGTSLLFTLIKGNPETGEKLLLDSKSFTK